MFHAKMLKKLILVKNLVTFSDRSGIPDVVVSRKGQPHRHLLRRRLSLRRPFGGAEIFSKLSTEVKNRFSVATEAPAK
jgi:hypothetical protein